MMPRSFTELALQVLLAGWLLLCSPWTLAEMRLQYLGTGPAQADPARMRAQSPPAGWSEGRIADLGTGSWWRVELPPAASVPAETSTPMPRVLYFDGAWSTRIALHLPGQAPIWRERFRGQGPDWGLPMELPVLLPPATAQPLVLHLYVNDPRAQRFFTVQTATLDDYLHRSLRHKYQITAATTALLTLAAMAFVLAGMLGNPNYHLVGAMACSLAAYVLMISGSLAQTAAWRLLGDYGVLAERMIVVLAVILSQAFIVRFLELRQRQRPGRTVLHVLSGLQLLTLAVTLANPTQPPAMGATLSNGLILIGIPVILHEAWRSLRAGMPTGRYVLWAWSPALVILLFWVLALEGLLQLRPLDLAGLVYSGFALQVGVLVFGVGADSARIRRERDQAPSRWPSAIR